MCSQLAAHHGPVAILPVHGSYAGQGGGLVAGSKPKDVSRPRSTAALTPMYDWLEPWWSLMRLCNILLKDATGIIFIVGLAQLVGFVVDQISKTPLEWKVLTVTISLEEIVSYGDLFVVAAFFYVAFRHILEWAKQ